MIGGDSMGNWSNLRLVVTGDPLDLTPFRRLAGALRGRIDASRSQIFTEDMEYGEGGDLEGDGVRRFHNYRRATYRFQGKNDYFDGHFQQVSRRFPRLAFVLVVGDPNGDWHGSYLLLRGRQREWTVPARVQGEIHERNCRLTGAITKDGKIDYDSDEAEVAFWDSHSEFMDAAEARWDPRVLDWLMALPKRRVASKKSRVGRTRRARKR
jgi:hypothetical protein